MKHHSTNNIRPDCRKLNVQAVVYAGSRDFFSLYLDPPGWQCNPGQFVMIRPCSWQNDPVWPRPFSICECSPEGLRLFIQVVGRGTRLISMLEPGAALDVWGPLGNGFDYEAEKPVLILAGGMGLAPFMSLCKTHPDPHNIELLFGHRAPLSCYPYAELPQKMPKKALQQNSQADLEEFQTVLKDKIQNFASMGRILACGPSPFLKVVQKYSLEFGTDAWLSLENKMACGVGACLGCVTRTVDDKYVQTCTCGPVFRADMIAPDAWS